MSGDLERIRKALLFVSAADRDTWVKMGMAVKAELGDAGFDLWDEWSQQADSYNPKDAHDVWKSIRTNGKVTAGTLFHEAKANGWRDDAPYHRLTPEALAERKRIAAERVVQEEAEIARERAEAAEKAAAIWKSATSVNVDHAYLRRKRIKPNGARLYKDSLLISLSAEGKIHSLQFIGPDGDKRFLSGGRVAGCYFSIGNTRGAAALCIAEGFATGATLFEATGYPVVVAFNAGNLLSVAKTMRKKFPDLPLILCADDDRQTPGNPGLTKANEAARAVGGLLAIPDFVGVAV